MAIGSEKFVALTTYRKDGTSSSTPMWIIDLDDGRIGLITPSHSLKVKRLTNDYRVQIQPCDRKGNVRDGTCPVDGTAIVVDGAEFETTRQRIKSKYSFFMNQLWSLGTLVARVIGKGDHRPNRAIVITLDPT